MFFELHGENKIGYKVLSEADLGIGADSHQTHIGLSEHVLTFLPDRDKISEDSIFIYEDKFEYIDAYFGRIERPDGSFRSPKIRIGDRGCVSIVSTIREIVRKNIGSSIWCLLWFGLKNEKVVFFLFNSNSADYINIETAGLPFDKKGTRAISNEHPSFDLLVQYLENKVNANGVEVLKELEVVSQTQDLQLDRRFKKYDIEKANLRFREIGRDGEHRVAQYLSRKVENGELSCFTWHNEHGESGLPYDFTVQDNRANFYYFDVKTTGYDFNQKMIFSTQEIEFIADPAVNYCIYRVYKSSSECYFLRICDDCKDLSSQIWSQTKVYAHGLERLQVELQSAKLAISPNLPLLRFKPEMTISTP